MPWKGLPGIENQVEANFLRPVLLGESIVPFRLHKAFEGVVPVEVSGTVLDSKLLWEEGLITLLVGCGKPRPFGSKIGDPEDTR